MSGVRHLWRSPPLVPTRVLTRAREDSDSAALGLPSWPLYSREAPTTRHEAALLALTLVCSWRRSEGPRGLYAGLRPTILGIVPYSGLSFSAFETLKAHLRDSSRTRAGRETAER